MLNVKRASNEAQSDASSSYASVAATGAGSSSANESASASSSSKPTHTGRPNMPRQRSRGQLARRHSITRGSDVHSERAAQGNKRRKGAAHTAAAGQAKLASASDTRGVGGSAERPWLGGLYFTDIVFIAFTYSINLLRTLGLAELADVMLKGFVYALTQLPLDLYKRWSLSTPPYSATAVSRKNAAKIRRRRQRETKDLVAAQGSSSDSDPSDSLTGQPRIFASSHEQGPETTVIDQLSPFHHLVILLSRFACDNFPHLLPRVLFAEETIGPFVYWRTGGGSNAMVQEFTDLNERKTPLLKGHSPHGQHTTTKKSDDGSFRAYLLSKDARLPIDVQRSNLASRRATTLLYLHGGGFSLGSVAFYAEALLRLRAKVALLESDEPYDVDNPIAEARCIAVEYDLSPAARFPQPLLQCLRCYAHLIEVEQIHPDSICIAGDSAGGNLAMGMLLCLDGQMRDEPLLGERDWSQLPMPGKAVLISPWVDLRPSKAHAFANLRQQSGLPDRKDPINNPKDDEIRKQKAPSDKAASTWTDAVAKYEWDYVASEALLHFAQVYAGVLPLPRRVHGPMGWIAHVCGVLAMQYDSDDEIEQETKPKGFMDPSRALSVLSRPSRRIARATQHALNDPLLPRLLGLTKGGTDADDAQTISRSDSITAGFEPLFTPADRQTDVVASKSQLYESIEGPLSATGADKIGMDQQGIQARLRGRHLLDTHPLLSPAVGDWSRIKLKHGCLVTWGERERMADDIEAWVDSLVNQSQHARSASDAPAPDGHSHANNEASSMAEYNDIGDASEQIHRAAESAEGDEDWVYTAVEKGPGGVHAWPFVSMYLAGSEGERERGLNLLARFVARTQLDDDAVEQFDNPSAPNLDTDFCMPRNTDYVSSSEVDPPHAAPDSPDVEDDDASVGSMPSDVDLHGLVDDPKQDDLPSFGAVNIADAVRKAQALGYTDVDPAIGSEDGETTVSDESSAQLTPRLAPQTIKSTPAPAPVLKREPDQVRERGRSRSPRKAVHYATPAPQQHTTDSSHFVSSVQLHRPQSTAVFTTTNQHSLAQPRPQSTTPLWWTGANVGTRSSRSAEKEPDSTASGDVRDRPAGADVVDAEDDEDEDQEGEEASPIDTRDGSRYGLEDIQEVSSEEALSPARSVSPPELPSNLSVNVDPGFYGLSRWAIQRPEPEGLSDIAEEGSVLSASVTSAGEDVRSRSMSPAGAWRTGNGAEGHNHGQYSSPSLTVAATKFMQDQQRPGPASTAIGSETPRQWRFLRDEIGARRAMEGDQAEEELGQDPPSPGGDRAFSPPAKPQPGRSLPVVVSSGARPQAETQDREAASTSTERGDTSGPISIQRKKPKGDVWW